MKYYFTSPNFNAALNYEIGDYNFQRDSYMSELVESLVASILFKIKTLSNQYLDLFYLTGSNQADFLVCIGDEKKIPVEVTFGKKPKRYVKNSIRRYDSDYGIIISDAISFTRKTDKIIYLPITTFSLI